MRIATFDIETWDLTAPFGPLVCASVLSQEPGFEDRMVTFRQDEYVKSGAAEDMLDDRQLLCDLRDFIEEHNLSIGWFSKGFDIKHVRSRLALHGERLLKSMWHYDAMWGYKGWRGVSFGSAKMKNVAKNMGVAIGVEQKPDVSAETWLSAKLGKKKAVDAVAERCEADVRITQKLAQYGMDNMLLKRIELYP